MDPNTKVPSARIVMSDEDLAALPAVIDIPTAARALGISSKKAYRLVRQGEFPVQTFLLGDRSRKVAKHQLLAYLGITPAA